MDNSLDCAALRVCIYQNILTMTRVPMEEAGKHNLHGRLFSTTITDIKGLPTLLRLSWCSNTAYIDLIHINICYLLIIFLSFSLVKGVVG